MLSFASEAKDIVDITDTDFSSSVDDVIQNILEFNYMSTSLCLKIMSFDLLNQLFIHPSNPYNGSLFCVDSCVGHGHKTGTNLYAALHRVNEKMSFLRQDKTNNRYNDTQNIIIIATDGENTRRTSQTDAQKQRFFKTTAPFLFLIIVHPLLMSNCLQVTPTQGQALSWPSLISGICWVILTQAPIIQMREC